MHPPPAHLSPRPSCLERPAQHAGAGVVKAMAVSEGPGPEGQADPAGDDFPEASCIEAMIEKIKAL